MLLNGITPMIVLGIRRCLKNIGLRLDEAKRGVIGKGPLSSYPWTVCYIRREESKRNVMIGGQQVN